MYIQCTQKLLDKLTMPHGKMPHPPEPVFCWHANFFEYHGVSYVAMINDETGEEVFFPVDSFQGFNQIVVDELQLEMEDAGLSEEKIQAYMLQAGSPVFGPTSGRTFVGRLNGFTQRMKGFIEKVHDLKDMLESESEVDDLFNQSDEMMEYPSGIQEKPISGKGTKQDEPERIITPMIALDVELQLLGKKKVKRSFFLPIEINFAALHDILQIGFGWSDSHLHEFDFSQHGFVIGPLESQLGEELGPHDIPGFHDEDTTALTDMLPSVRRFSYIYDFGDNWEHVIKVGKVDFIEGEPYALCTGGQGITPPEDCGGAEGFAELLEILKDPSHTEYEEMKSWVGDALDGRFDRAEINEELEELVFTPQFD